MLTLTSPVHSVPKIGPKYFKLLQNLNIETVEDLLYHVPFRYDDFSKVVNIADVQEDDAVTIEAFLSKIDNIFTRNRKRLTKAKVADFTGEMELIWFNQHYIKRSLTKGKKYYFSGKVQKFGSKLNLVAPNFEEAGEGTINTARLVPVYNTTQGITSKWLRTRISDVLNVLKDSQALSEFLPHKTLKKHNLLGLEKSLNDIHFPPSQKEIIPAKNRLAFEELLVEMLKVEERKHFWGKKQAGVHIEQKTHAKKLEKFIKSLPFKLTGSQNRAIKEILHDLDTPHPMNRLLEGDVGSGKTIVAIAAAYLTHLNGYKTLYMAPTEILAKQHYETFLKFLDGTDVNIKIKTGINKKTDVTSEKNDVIIGTHALLHEKEEFHNVGLIIIDEQHRFGVEQRAKIVQMGTKKEVPNLLTMTATPIPRTLALTLYGDLDISVLDEVPNVGKKITTSVVAEKFRQKTFEWIKQSGEQAFVVCPFIQESYVEMFENVKAAQKEYDLLKAGVFANVPMGLLHGKMKNKEKDVVMNDFRAGKIRVLVSTPVIEVGVDVPEATIMVIESGERYGLASLHQLRGRVGRGSKEGYCFVFMSDYSKTGFARLKNLEKEDSGLKLAEIDLKFRGQGDVYGKMQHGFKEFRVADIKNLEMLEAAKVEAQELFSELDKHKKLKTKILQKTMLVAQN